MTDNRSQALLQSIMNAKIYHDVTEEKRRSALPLITVSRGKGANGGRIARMLSERLDIPLYDRKLIDEVAKRSKSDPYLTRKLDEHMSSLVDEWVRSLFTGKNASRDTFNYHLIKVIMNIAPHGGVIVGRGAHLLLGNYKVFRMRVEGSLHRCAERVSKREGVKMSKAKTLVERADLERQEFVHNLYKNHVAPHNFYDMSVNTDLFSNKTVVELVLDGMREMGFVQAR
uniref:Cytidylate kinase n=1 Tax=Magnetococcus massalia (strain MO-1) TaxID=451514 RepID=A0A1S7LDU5_MAGMO|nr:conserved protein of unknown function [Candidatus Magnetococcus massalia]